MKYIVSVSMTNVRGSTQSIEIEIDDNATEEEIEEICRETAFNEVDWSFEKEEDERD